MDGPSPHDEFPKLLHQQAGSAGRACRRAPWQGVISTRSITCMFKKLSSLFSKPDEIGDIEGKPELIAIEHDDYHAEHIGRTKDDFQFFLTTPFEPKLGSSEGCEYLALFKFDLAGNLVDSEIEAFGSRENYDEDKRKSRYLEMLRSLGEIQYQRIEVKPFSVNYNGTDIGLIVREPEDEDDVWAVELLPGNYMAFFEPWDSGEYDT